MKKLLRSASLRRQLASEARRHVEQRFSPVRQRSLLEMLYRTLLGNAFYMEIEEPLHGVA